MTEVTVYEDGRIVTRWFECWDDDGDIAGEWVNDRVVGTMTLPAWAWSERDD